jgi:hypothetical protein
MTEPLTPDYMWERMSDLLNLLGIAGPNIYHRIATDEDNAKVDPAVIAATSDDEWCVCGRIWPCEARQLAGLVALAEADAARQSDDRLREAFLAGVRRGSSDGMEGYPMVADDWLAAHPAHDPTPSGTPDRERDFLTRVIAAAEAEWDSSQGAHDAFVAGAVAAALASHPTPSGDHTDDPVTHDPRCVSVSRWHVGECYLPSGTPDRARSDLPHPGHAPGDWSCTEACFAPDRERLAALAFPGPGLDPWQKGWNAALQAAGRAGVHPAAPSLDMELGTHDARQHHRPEDYR